MTATESGRTRRPQLNETITHLNDIIEGLSTAVPAVVAEALQQALGADFAAAVGEAVADALTPHLRDLVKAEVAAVRADLPPVRPPVTETPAPPPRRVTTPPKSTRMDRIRAGLNQARAWAVRQWDMLLGVMVIGWAMLRLLAVAVSHSPTAVIVAVVTGVGFGILAAVTNPAVAVVLTALATGTLTASAVSAAPLVREVVKSDLNVNRETA